VNVRFLEQALAELEEAASYYDQGRPALSGAFYSEIDAALALLIEYPEESPAGAYGVRRRNPKRFLYVLIYQIVDSEIIVAAVARTHRCPEYWRNRL
jgi:plasmid stabilization system protein ParE